MKNETITNSLSHTMELQVSHSVCTKVSPKSIFRRKEKRNRSNIKRVV